MPTNPPRHAEVPKANRLRLAEYDAGKGVSLVLAVDDKRVGEIGIDVGNAV